MASVTRNLSVVRSMIDAQEVYRTFVVPEHTTQVKVFMIAGGGAGAPVWYDSTISTDLDAADTEGCTLNCGGGGGGAGASAYKTFNVVAGDVFYLDVAPNKPRNFMSSTHGYGYNGDSSNDGEDTSITFRNIKYTVGGGKRGGTAPNFGPFKGGIGGEAAQEIKADPEWTFMDGGSGGFGEGANMELKPGKEDPFEIASLLADAPTHGIDPDTSDLNFTPGAPGSTTTNSSFANMGYGHCAGGGGGCPGGVPTWAISFLLGTDRNPPADYSSSGGDGGSGGDGTPGNPGPEGVNWQGPDRFIYDSNFPPIMAAVDGGDCGGNIDPEGTFNGKTGGPQPGCGGGGAGVPSYQTNPLLAKPTAGVGGGGGGGLILFQYEFQDPGPFMNIIGDDTVIEVGGAFVDPGCEAIENDPIADNFGFSLPVTVTGVDNIDLNKPGTYFVTYTAKNSSGVENMVTRRVTIADDVSPPILSVNGSTTTYHQQGSAYVDQGATAVDNVDGNITSKIVVTNGVNINKVGTYTVKYEIRDSAGNLSTAIRNVIVQNVPPPTPVSGKPINVPASGSFSIGNIHRASATWKSVNSTGGVTNASSGEGSLVYSENKISALRERMQSHGFKGGYTYNTTAMGANLPSNNKELKMSKFRDISTLTVRMRAKPETYELYRSSQDGQFEIFAFGSTTKNPYTITMTSASNGNSGVKKNIGYGTHAKFTGLGAKGSVGKSNESRQKGAQEKAKKGSRIDESTSVSSIKIQWNNSSGTTTTFDNLAVGIGQHTTSYSKGSTYAAVVHGNWTGTITSQSGYWGKLLWSGSSTAKAKLSDWITYHCGHQQFER